MGACVSRKKEKKNDSIKKSRCNKVTNCIFVRLSGAKYTRSLMRIYIRKIKLKRNTDNHNHNKKRTAIVRECRQNISCCYDFDNNNK